MSCPMLLETVPTNFRVLISVHVGVVTGVGELIREFQLGVEKAGGRSDG